MKAFNLNDVIYEANRKIEMATKDREQAMTRWMQYSEGVDFSGSAWSYLPTIARAEATIVEWTQLVGVCNFEGMTVEKLIEVISDKQERFFSAFSVPSSSSGISSNVDSFKLEAKVAFLNDLSWIKSRLSA